MTAAFLYSLALFFHILGGFGLIAALACEAIGLRGQRRAVQADDARLWLGISRGLVLRLAPSSLVLILVTGLYMTATRWGWKGWILVALASLVLLALVGAMGTGIPISRVEAAIGRASGPLADNLKAALRSPALVTSLRTRLGLVVGIAFLMTVKPPAVASAVVIVVASTLGFLSGRIPSRRTGDERRTANG